MTFSLVARCATTGRFGVAIASSSPAVAARCAYSRAGIGAVATQNVTDPTLGPLMLDLLQEGLDAPTALERLRQRSRHMAWRQVLAVDADGRTAMHTGREALGLFSEAEAINVAAGGNLLADAGVPRAMVESFVASAGEDLGDRLLDALRAGLAAGGEAGPVHSAGLQLCDKLSWPIADLRCDWSDECPIMAITQAWNVYRPQMAAYVTRALDPRAAPSYGVPGDAEGPPE